MLDMERARTQSDPLVRLSFTWLTLLEHKGDNKMKAYHSGFLKGVSRVSVLIFACATCVIGQSAANSKPEPPKTTAAAQALAPAASVADGFTLAAVGDLMYSAPMSGLPDSRFQSVLKLLRNADATFGNLENTLIDLSSFQGYPQGECGGTHLLGSPAIAKDMRTMGFNLVSRANNHTTDWGIEGMRVTDQAADEAGLVHAGTGYNKAAARAAHYLQTSKGRVGLVSMTSTFMPMSVAADPLGRMPGRPGVNALRTIVTDVVSPKMLESLRTIHNALPAAELKQEEDIRKALHPEGEDKGKPEKLNLFGLNFQAGDKPVRYSFEMNDSDLREILKSIRQGKENSNFLIATIHAHDPDNYSDEPADFLPKLAHEAIDAGADAFIGHGPHQLRAIEIYKGKPIFYSLGNFFFHQAMQEPISPEVYEAFNSDPAVVTDSEFDAKEIKAWFNSPIWFQSIIAVSRFEGGKIAEIRLYPIDLGFKAIATDQGVPRIASPEIANLILENLQRLSKPYGTDIAIENGVGIIRLQK
jgi:poly-gamma-glutamate synthesis protein (capsule biosynthesis protein)